MPDPVRTTAVWCARWPVIAAGGVDREVAVMHANRVVAVSVAAEAAGVTPGMRKRDSQRRCPSLELVDHDPGRDARAFEPVVRALESVSPRIEITEPGACAFAARGPARYFGGEAKLVARTRAMVCEVIGMPSDAVAVGVADGPFAAFIAARTGAGVVARGGARGFLARFPITSLRTAVTGGADLVDVWQRLGIHTLEAFAALPAADVLARFGTEGAHAHALASGGDQRLLNALVPGIDFVVDTELDPPADRVDVAAFATKALAGELHERLASRGLACTQLVIHAETEHGEILERVWRHEGALSAGAIAERLRWQLDGWLNGPLASRPTSGIVLMRLIPDGVVGDTGRQMGLWGGQTAADERAIRGVARLTGMVGVDAVQVLERRGGRHPAAGMVLVRSDRVDLERRAVVSGALQPGLSGALQPGLSGALQPWPGTLPAPSPTVLHQPAVPCEVVDAVDRPVVVSGRGVVSAAPARMRLAGSGWAEVSRWAGPWPIDERWWDTGAHVRRARFQVLTADGAARLVVIERGRWTCEATYD